MWRLIIPSRIRENFIPPPLFFSHVQRYIARFDSHADNMYNERKCANMQCARIVTRRVVAREDNHQEHVGSFEQADNLEVSATTSSTMSRDIL